MYLAAFDVFRASTHVHGHSHDNPQPGLDGSCPPQRHACVSSELGVLEAIQLLLSVRQALCKAVSVCIGQIMVCRKGLRIRGTQKSTDMSEGRLHQNLHLNIRDYKAEY